MTGCIFAWLQYRAPLKRIVFVCLALAAALLANWLRAYAIVLMSHFSDNTVGTGPDHNWWGWLIFGAAMFVLFSVGMRWTDKKGDSPLQLAAVQGGAPAVPGYAIAMSLAACLLLVAAWPAAAARIESHVDTRPLVIEAIARRGKMIIPRPVGRPDCRTSAVDVQTFVREGSSGCFSGVYATKEGVEWSHQ